MAMPDHIINPLQSTNVQINLSARLSIHSNMPYIMWFNTARHKLIEMVVPLLPFALTAFAYGLDADSDGTPASPASGPTAGFQACAGDGLAG